MNFAKLSVEEKRAMARKGGQAANRAPTARWWTTEQARAYGRLGGRLGGKASSGNTGNVKCRTRKLPADQVAPRTCVYGTKRCLARHRAKP